MNREQTPYYKSSVYHRGTALGLSQLTLIMIVALTTSVLLLKKANPDYYSRCIQSCEEPTKQDLGSLQSCKTNCSTQQLLPRRLTSSLGGNEAALFLFILASVLLVTPFWISNRKFGRKKAFAVPYFIVFTTLEAFMMAVLLSSLGIGYMDNGSDSCLIVPGYYWHCAFYWAFIELYIGFAILFLAKIAKRFFNAIPSHSKTADYWSALSLVIYFVASPFAYKELWFWILFIIILVLVLMSSYLYMKEMHDFAMQTKLNLTSEQDTLLVGLYFYQFGILMPMELLRAGLNFYHENVFNAWSSLDTDQNLQDKEYLENFYYAAYDS